MAAATQAEAEAAKQSSGSVSNNAKQNDQRAYFGRELKNAPHCRADDASTTITCATDK